VHGRDDQRRWSRRVLAPWRRVVGNGITRSGRASTGEQAYGVHAGGSHDLQAHGHDGVEHREV
jgi:hypothetical protein